MTDAWPVWLRTLLGAPLKIALIAVVAVLVRHLVHRIVDRVAEGIATGRGGLGRLDDHLPGAAAVLGSSPLLSARREQRARTTASVLKSATTAVVGIVALLTVLPLLDVSVAPLLASAGVVGVALGLGAQALIRDVLAGLFMIVEDQYGVGDFVDLGPASGTVESIGLRVTRLRGEDGTVWYIRNGEVQRVGNRSQGWSRAILDVGLNAGTDLALAEALVLDVAQDVAADEAFAGLVTAKPQVWGVESVDKDAVALRLVVRTAPLRQREVARELRRRLLDRFAKEQLAAPIGLDSPEEPAA